MDDAERAAQAIAADLTRLGVHPSGVLLMHSSLSSLGRVPGGPETVIRGLLQALGEQGTLLLPALSYQHVGPWQPVFDVRRTPSNVGAIPEYFRTRPGTRRSVHPTHSVCGVGPQRDAILADHIEDVTPVGAHSPFRKVRDLGGQVLFLGCGMRPNTSMHGVEELAGAPYMWGDWVDYRLILEDGREVAVRSRHHGFGRWQQRYDRLAELLTPEELHVGQVLAAKCHLLEAPALWERALAAMRVDPYHFVELGEG